MSGGTRPHRVTVRLSDQERTALERIALQTKVSEPVNAHVSYDRPARVSDVIRIALEDFIARTGTIPLPLDGTIGAQA